MAYFPPLTANQTVNISATSPIPVASSLGIGQISYIPSLTGTYTKIGTPPAGTKAVRMYLSTGDAVKFTVNNADLSGSAISGSSYYAPQFQYTLDNNVQNNITNKGIVYDLSAGGAINYVPGKIGTAMGSGMYARNYAIVPVISAYNDLTVEYWTRPLSANYGSIQVIVGQNKAWWTGVNVTGGLSLYVGAGTLQATINTTVPSGMYNNNWHHVAFTLSVSAGCKLFVDGSLINSIPGSVASYGGQWYNTLDVSNFRGAVGELSSNFTYWGYVDNIAIFNYLKYTTTFTPNTSSYETIDNIFTPGVSTNVPSYTISYNNTGPNWDEQLSNNNNIYISGISGSPLYKWL